MNPSLPARRGIIVLAGLWLIYLLSFEMPIPEERALFWLGRAIATLIAAVGLIMALRGKPKWLNVLAVAAIWILVVYAVRAVWLISNAAHLDLARGAAGPITDVSRLTVRAFTYLWIDEQSPIRALRFAYVELVMPLSQIIVLAWLVWRRPHAISSHQITN